MNVRAKVYCSSKVKQADGSTSVVLTGVPPGGKDIDGVNRAFADATPYLRMELVIASGRPAADAYEQGGMYYLDMTPAQDTSNGVQVSERVAEAEARAAARPEPIAASYTLNPLDVGAVDQPQPIVNAGSNY